MTSRKQSVSFTDQAFSYAQSLVDAGEYPTISAAVSGELVRARQQRDERKVLLQAEVERRRALPDDQWVAFETPAAFMEGAYAELQRLRAVQDAAE